MAGVEIDFSGLTKPATVLIERVSDAIGGIARPWQIERIAKAEAAAAVTQATAQITISELERRAIRRLVSEEGKKQQNIEAISYGATLFLENDATPENISEDWLSHFFERSRLASDYDMQVLWSKILAGEANTPSSFSRKTIDLISVIDNKDAFLLEKLSSYTISFLECDSSKFSFGKYTDHVPIIFEHCMPGKAADWMFEELVHLEDIGFIKFDPNARFSMMNVPTEMEFKFGDNIYFMRLENSPAHFSLGNVLLTKAGRQVIPLLSGSPNSEHLMKVIDRWLGDGCSVGSLLKTRRPQQ